METINHECYVSLEVAELLKEAGFNWECKKIYFKTGWKGNDDVWEIEDNKKKTNLVLELDYCMLVPTLDVAQRWLREVKGIYVESVLCVNRGTSGHSFGFSVAEVSADLSIVKILCPSTYFDEEETKGFKKYELSLEAGVKKALELILEKGKKK